MGRSVARIAAHHNAPARVQPAYVRRGGAFNQNLRVGQAHGAYPLTGVADLEGQLFSFLVPQGAADVVLARGLNIKVSLTLLYRRLNGQQQILGGHALVFVYRANAQHVLLLAKV